MYLKSLTVRGFKSFATSTTLRFEPGITCVVGPNGSGKSNVVDAIAWVLGEQGAKALRGGAMADVIFAGTPGRPALGRAEVVLTIDNSDGALPIDYTEVSVSRLLYRSGESEYAINGAACRLLDVQELMSDSGIGRELHVVVGQGQLDAVLSARPEDRRGFIEEAAGVLKHRKRKEKALRKLEAMQVNLSRVTDLAAELRRQLGPLGRQAEVARKASAIQAGLRDARLRLLADDMQTQSATLAREEADQASVLGRRGAVDQRLREAREREADVERAVSDGAPQLAAVQETYLRLAGLRERLRGLASLAEERRRHLDREGSDRSVGRDPEELESEALRVRSQEEALSAALLADRTRLDACAAERERLEASMAQEERAALAAARAAADRREGLARLTGQLAALRSREEAAQEEAGRLTGAVEEARARATAAAAEAAELRSGAGELDVDEAGLTQAHESALERLAEAEAAVTDLLAQERLAAQEQTAWASRRETLALTLERRDGAGALLAQSRPGVLGSVAALLDIEPGAQAALAAALGAVGEAVAVTSHQVALEALAELRDQQAGRAGLLVADLASGAAGLPSGAADLPAGAAPLPLGTVSALSLVRLPVQLQEPIQRLLAAVVVVPDLAEAAELLARYPHLTVVTREGDLLAADRALGGGGAPPSLLEMQAAADEADREARAAAERADRLVGELEAARERMASAADQVAAALHQLHESDAAMAAVAERIGLAAAQERAARAEVERLERSMEQAVQAAQASAAGIAELAERLAVARAQPEGEPEPDPAERDRLAAALAAARAAEVEARLTVRTAEERLRALAGRADALGRAASTERAERERAARRAERRAAGAALAAAVASAAADVLARAEASLAAAGQERDRVTAAATVREGELLALRAEVRELAVESDGLREAAHRDEVAQAEQRLRVEALTTRSLEEFGISAEELLAEYGPDRPVPAEDPEQGRSIPYDRQVLERRAAAAERQLRTLGKINPLALEEFAALEERQAFLSAQVEDLKGSRRDLLGIVREVDERILDAFRSAYEDTAREFAVVFATLFPGGEGSLSLTEPEDLLTTGVEVHARPAGKKVSRLSLLSGGERSLAAIALLVAIFRARPSPFYVLDEVEAALDDRNLGRLLECLEGLRQSSQLIVITHQKRTMEIADALYGVTMRGDGVSSVISQRLREPAAG